MSDEPIIDEDLEALLYAQLHYGNYSEKNEEISWMNDLTKTNREEQDQVETTRETTDSINKIYPKRRYFANKLILEDKEKENTVEKGPSTYLPEENLISENSVIHSTIESNIASEISQKSLPEPTIPSQKDQDIESTTSEQHQFIKISTSSPNTNLSSKDSTQIVTTTVLSTPGEPSHPQLLNNITINQYLFPSDFEQRLQSSLENNPLSKKSKSDLNKLRKGYINEQTFFNNLKKRLRIQKKKQNQNQIRRALLKRQLNIVHSEVICLSDTDSSDIEVVEVTNISKDSKNMPAVMTEAADDDEIIYVAPPPVPVINIDTESDSETSDKDKETSEEILPIGGQTNKEESTSVNPPDSQPDIDETSDDFLQPKNNPDNFNFSLHGSDFQNTEFVRPANPTDVYETESSTSTSDFNRDSSRQFCNTVKTIVFSEVEFPSQDIFDESNLESFGEFITPKRGDKGKRAAETTLTTIEKSSNSKCSKRVIPRASSESSSESEYEDSHAHQNLPDLSPMLCAKSSPRKNKKSSAEQAKKKKGKLEEVESNNKSSKKKLTEKSSDNNEILDAVEPELPARKSKRKSSSAVEDEEIPKKKSKKKKNKSDHRCTDDNEVSEASNSASDKNVSCSSPKKNVNDTSVTPSSTPSKKTIIEDESDLSNVDESKRKSKKKKRHATKESLVSDALDENNLDKEQDNGQGTKKKNKKRKKKDSSESRVALEASFTTTDENEPSKGIDTVKDGSSSNKLSEEQDSLSKKKNKKKKTVSSENRNSVDESNIENETVKDTETNENERLEEGKIVEAHANIAGDPQSHQEEEEEDIIIIERDIPVHTIESSESSDEDIITFDVRDDIELGNIVVSNTKDKLNNVIDNKNFDVDYVQSNMSDDPEKWKILPSDRYNINIVKKGPRCNKCRHFGHKSIYCPNKPALPVCILCGEAGHQEPRCPNKVCFTCGKSGSFSTVYCYKCVQQRKDKCSLCSIVGHRSDYCPDLWRRYCLTIKEGPLKPPKRSRRGFKKLKPRNKQWCSGCASNGHLEFECNSYKWIREYPASSPRTFKYTDVYLEQIKKKTRRSRQENYAADFRILDKNLEEIDSQESVTIAAVNREIGENTAESRENKNESQLENQPNIEFQDTSAHTSHEGHNPGEIPDIRFLNVNPPGHSITLPSSNQMIYNIDGGQSRPPMRVSEGRGRAIPNRFQRHAKINPVSVLRPTPYTPYHSVLNPYSLMGAPIGLTQQAMLNQAPNYLAQQLVELANAVSRYPGSNNFEQDDYTTDFYQPPPQQFGSQIPPLLGHPPNLYTDFSGPLIPETYHGIQEPQDVHVNRDFLNIPHTITRDPTEARERLDYQAPQPSEEHNTEERQHFIEDRERQENLQRQLEDDFVINMHERLRYVKRIGKWSGRQCRPRSPGPNIRSLDTPPAARLEPLMSDDIPRTETPQIQFQNSNHDFIPLNTAGEENVEVFNNTSNNITVDDGVVKKFNTSSALQLKQLISKDLSKLDVVLKSDIKSYKKKLNTIDNLKKIEIKTNGVRKQMYFLFKQLNMLLFGMHRLGEGSRNLNYLRRFAFAYPGGVVGHSKRKSLLQAYGYIFGGEHPDFNYRRYINNLTVMNKK